MSDAGDELYDVISRICERQRGYRAISPIALASEAMQAIDFPISLHPLGYIGCERHFREIARSTLRKRFDPVDPEKEQDDLFRIRCKSVTRSGASAAKTRATCCASISRMLIAPTTWRGCVARAMRNSNIADALEAEGASRMAA